MERAKEIIGNFPKHDIQIIGHKLTARSALSVALANKNLPVIQLLEVYRAPPRLVDPYNGLSYDGQLVSRKVSRLTQSCT